MKLRAAIALKAGKSLERVDIDVEGPTAGEMLPQGESIRTMLHY